MKRLHIIFLFLFIVGCSGTEAAKVDDQVIPGPIEDDGPGWVFGGTPPAGDEAPAEGGEPNGQPPPPPPARQEDEIKPVKFDSRPDLKKCSLDKPCEKSIRAKGGSGEYVWLVADGSNLPDGLELVVGENSKEAKVQNKEGAEIKTGEFKFTLKVADAADETNAAEMEFKLSIEIKEELSFVLYTWSKDDSDQVVWSGPYMWKEVEGVEGWRDASGAQQVDITVPPNGRFVVAVKGQAPSYEWSFGGDKVDCSENGECSLTKGELTFYKDASIQPQLDDVENVQSMVLKQDSGALGVKKVANISAKDEFDNKIEQQIPVTFAKDPCETTLQASIAGVFEKGTDQGARSGGSDEDEAKYRILKRDTSYYVKLQVSGGKAPYNVTSATIDDRPQSLPTSSETSELRVDIDLSGRKPGDKVEGVFTIGDSCDETSSAEVKQTFQLGCQIGEPGQEVSLHALYRGNSSADTDVSDWDKAGFMLKGANDDELMWTGWYRPDPNDNGTIDDYSPVWKKQLPENVCPEDIKYVEYAFRYGDGLHMPDVYVNRAMIRAASGKDERNREKYVYAGWKGKAMGGDDLGNSNWKRAFIACKDWDSAMNPNSSVECLGANDSIWGDKNPFESEWKDWPDNPDA